MFYWTNLRQELDNYAAYLQYSYKSRVQVKTGALRKSIKVWCVWNDSTYSLCLDMLDYWKWIPEAFNVKKAAEVAGTAQGSTNVFVDMEYGSAPTLHKGYYDTGRRYPINWDTWQQRLNDAFLKDIQAAIEAEEG